MIVYKVVRRENDKLYSLNSGLKRFEVEYIPKRKTKPKVAGTRLYVFTELAVAKEWAKNNGCEVWECSVDKLYKFVCADTFEVEEFWKAKLAHKSAALYTRNTSTTYFYNSFVSARCVDSLRLLKKVG